MSPQPAVRSAWRRAFRPLMGGVLMCAVAATVATGVTWLADNTASQQSQAQSALRVAEQTLRNTQLDMVRLEDNLHTYDTLKKAGFLGSPDRLSLLEALESAAKELHQSAFEWELGPQERIHVLIDTKTGAAVAQLVRISMKLTASGVHEEEWLQLLARLQANGVGLFVSNTCVYQPQSYSTDRRAVPAVKVACDLSWLYVVAEGTTAGLAQADAVLAARTPQANALGVLGTLILSPSQRRELEALRLAPSSANESGLGALGSSLATDRGLGSSDSPSPQVVNGVVIRSGHHSTVWVNGQPQYGRATADPLRALTGQTRDALPPGAIRIIPPKAGVTAHKESRH